MSRSVSTQVAVGPALGLTVGWLAGGMIQILAFEVDPRDPMIFGGVTLVVVLVSLLATLSVPRFTPCASVPCRRCGTTERRPDIVSRGASKTHKCPSDVSSTDRLTQAARNRCATWRYRR